MHNSWHTKSKEDIFRELKTSEKGLSNEEAKKRIAEHGYNEISEKKKASQILVYLKQLNSPLTYVLFVAMVISFAFGSLIDGYVILAVLLINATISYMQERKAERAINALKKIIVFYAKVYRNNELVKIPTRELIPGDLIFLEGGDKVPADARLISAKNFRTQESSLTGESFPEDKDLDILGEKTPLADRRNMVYMGTLVVSGTGKAIVTDTRNQTALGQVAKSIQEVAAPKMHFNKKVSQLALQMTIFASIGAGLTFVIGFFIKKLEFFEIFLFTIASLVSGIPEGLPAILVIVLAIGARRMAKKNAVIRHLPAVETLGVATVIATDKTGTLTENSITVEKILTADEEFLITGNGWQPIGKFFKKGEKSPIHPKKFPSLEKIFSISTLCNKGNLVRKNGSYEIIGDPTEVSLLVMAKKAGVEKRDLMKKEKLIDDLAFSSDLKFRASLIELNGGSCFIDSLR